MNWDVVLGGVPTKNCDIPTPLRSIWLLGRRNWKISLVDVPFLLFILKFLEKCHLFLSPCICHCFNIELMQQQKQWSKLAKGLETREKSYKHFNVKLWLELDLIPSIRSQMSKKNLNIFLSNLINKTDQMNSIMAYFYCNLNNVIKLREYYTSIYNL